MHLSTTRREAKGRCTPTTNRKLLYQLKRVVVGPIIIADYMQSLPNFQSEKKDRSFGHPPAPEEEGFELVQFQQSNNEIARLLTIPGTDLVEVDLPKEVIASTSTSGELAAINLNSKTMDHFVGINNQLINNQTNHE